VPAAASSAKLASERKTRRRDEWRDGMATDPWLEDGRCGS
jgi:hypothetical protein